MAHTSHGRDRISARGHIEESACIGGSAAGRTNSPPASVGPTSPELGRADRHGPGGDFEAVMRHPAYKDIIVDHKRSGTWRFGMCRTVIRPQPIDNVSASYSALAFHRKPTRLRLEVMGKARPVRDYLPGEVLVRPSGLDWRSRYFKPAEVSVLALPTSTVREVLDDPLADVEDAMSSFETRPFWSPLVSELVRRLDTEVFDRSNASPLLLDTLFQAVCWELWEMSRNRSRTSGNRSAGPQISERGLRNVDQYIDETGIRRVDFEALSRLTDLPPSQVHNAFKRTVGETPYRYILARRLKRARFMIETTTTPLSEIAYRCGFSSQAHLTETMRSRLGTAPGALRKVALK